MSTLGELNVLIGANIDQFEAAMRDVQQGIGRVGDGAKQLGGSLTTYVTAPLALLGGAAVAAFGKMDALGRGLQAVTQQELGEKGVKGVDAIGQAASETKARLVELDAIGRLPGISLEQAIKGDIRLRAVGISAGQSAKVLREFANAIATTGGSAADLDGVTVQLAQLSAKGKVLSADLRPIIERTPILAGVLKDLYGTVDAETISASLAKQGKSSTDFIATITEALGKLPRVTGGVSNQLENLGQTGQAALAKLGEAFSKSVNLPAILDKLTNGIESLADSFVSLSPSTQKAIFGFAAAAAAAGPIVFGLGAIAAAIPPVVAGLEVLGLTSAAAFGPIGVGAAAVAVAASLIVSNWGEVVSYFNSSEVANLFSNLAAAAESAADAIGEAFSTIAANSQNTLGGMVSSQGAIRQIIGVLTVDATSAANIFAGTLHGITSLLTGEFSQALAGGKQALFGFIDPLAALAGFDVRREEANPILVLSRSATEFNAVIPQLAANLTLLSKATADAFSGPEGADYFGAGVDAVAGKIAKLEERIKALKDAKPTLQFDQDIAAANVLLASLEAELKRLNELGIGSKKARDAIAALRLELSRLTALDGFLGDAPSQMQVLERRADALAGGLKKLVEAGVPTSSKAFQGFAQDLVNTAQAFDRLAASGGALKLKPVEVRSLVPTTLGDTLSADVARLLGDYALQPLKLKAPIKLEPIISGFGDLKASIQDGFLDAYKGIKTAGIGKPLLEISQGFAAVDRAAALFGGAFDDAGGKAGVLQATLQQMLKDGVNPLTPEVEKLAGQLKGFALESEKTSAATQAVKAGFFELTSGISAAFSDALSGSQDIGDALLQTLLSTVSSIATQLGGILLASGLGIEALKVSLKTFSGVGAIAAGLALLAIGGAASAAAANLGKSGGGGAGSAGLATPSPNSTISAGKPAPIEVVFKIKGQELQGMARLELYRNQRTN